MQRYAFDVVSDFNLRGSNRPELQRQDLLAQFTEDEESERVQNGCEGKGCELLGKST